jgi:hypothetical protein
MEGINKSFLIIIIKIEKTKNINELTNIELNPSQLLKIIKSMVPSKKSVPKNFFLFSFNLIVFFLNT